MMHIRRMAAVFCSRWHDVVGTHACLGNGVSQQIRMLKRQAMEAVEDMEEMRRTHKDNAHVSMQLLKKASVWRFMAWHVV